MSRPALAERLGAAARVTVVPGPPGSAKTLLLRSWAGDAALADSAAWVSVRAWTGWSVVERLLKDLAPLQDRLWLLIDDVHELRSGRELFHGAGVELADPALVMLHERTEGRAAGLRAGRSVAGGAPRSGAVRGGVLRQ